MVYEFQLSVAMYFYVACVLFHLLILALAQHLAQSEYYGERCSEFVGDVGEEGLAHFCEFLQCQMVASVYALYVYDHAYCA